MTRTHTRVAPLAILALVACLAPGARAAAPAPGPAGLGHLFLPREGKMVQYSSHAATGGAVDSWPVPPGKTVTVVDHKGAGIVRRWWMTVLQHEKSANILREIIIRCYWDGESEPSVEAPLSDFFAMSFGEARDFTSIPVTVTSGGMNCYWPMPFRSTARITVENRAAVAVSGLYFNIAVETLPSLPRSAYYFHAQFRRASPTVQGRPVTVLEATGAGQYVGTVLSARTLRGVGPRFLEGNEYVFVDGEKEPSIGGTGTEDYFSSGLYFVTGAFSAPYHGVTVLDLEKNRVGAYRWHIEDAIPFTRSLRFELQHGPDNNVPADYATLALWYQTHPHAKFPPLPKELGPMQEQAPFQIQGAIEAEHLLGGASASGGKLSLQSMAEYAGDWSGDAQLLWRSTSPGDHLTLFVAAPEAGEREVIVYPTRSEDYGDWRILHQGRELATVRGYGKGVAPAGPVSLGRVKVERGPNAFLIEVAGKDARSAGYTVGIDALRIVP